MKKEIKKYTYVDSFEFPLYGSKFVLILSNDIDAVHGLVPTHNYDHDLFAHTYDTIYKNRYARMVVFNFDKYPGSKLTHGIIAHEAIHVVNFLCSWKGVLLDAANDEPIAYLLEWVIDKMYSCIKKHGFENAIK